MDEKHLNERIQCSKNINKREKNNFLRFMNPLSFKYFKFSVNTLCEGVTNRTNKDQLLFSPSHLPQKHSLLVSSVSSSCQFSDHISVTSSSFRLTVQRIFLDLILVYHPLTRYICSQDVYKTLCQICTFLAKLYYNQMLL